MVLGAIRKFLSGESSTSNIRMEKTSAVADGISKEEIEKAIRHGKLDKLWARRRGEPYPFTTRVQDEVLDEPYTVEMEGKGREEVPDEFYERFAEAETREEVDRLIDRYQSQIPGSVELVVDPEY